MSCTPLDPTTLEQLHKTEYNLMIKSIIEFLLSDTMSDAKEDLELHDKKLESELNVKTEEQFPKSNSRKDEMKTPSDGKHETKFPKSNARKDKMAKTKEDEPNKRSKVTFSDPLSIDLTNSGRTVSRKRKAEDKPEAKLIKKI